MSHVNIEKYHNFKIYLWHMFCRVTKFLIAHGYENIGGVNTPPETL